MCLKWSLVPLLSFVTAATVAGSDGTLFWADGGSLEGTLLSCDSQTLVWQTPLFKDPLEIQLQELAGVRFHEHAARPAGDPFRVVLRSGDILTGSLSAVSEELLAFESYRHGKLRLLRQHVRKMQRIDTSDLIYVGPQNLRKWKNPESTEVVEDWREESVGHISTSASDAAIFRDLMLPDTCEIEIVMQSLQCPAFTVGFSPDEVNSLRLETWENVLVAVSDLDFVVVETLDPEQREVRLRLFLDRNAGTLAVWSDTGGRLASIQGKQGRSPESGVLFRNNGSDLTLARLQVSHWSGEIPRLVKEENSRVQLSDGSIRNGELTEMIDDGKTLVLTDGDIVSEVPMAAIRAITVNDDPAEIVQSPAARMFWDDGSIVSGELREIRNDTVVTETGYSFTPIASALAGMRRISLLGTDSLSDQPDRLLVNDGTVHGTLVIGVDDEAPVQWKASGAVNASPLTGDGAARILRGGQAEPLPFDPEAFPDKIYLTNNDILPCCLESCLEDSVTIASPLTERKQIAAESVVAVELASAGGGTQRSFGRGNWRRVAGTATIMDDRILFGSASTVGCLKVLTGDTVEFSMNWHASANVTLSVYLFADQLNVASETATSVSFQCSNDRLSVSAGSSSQQERLFDFHQGALQEAATVVEVSNHSARVAINVRAGEVHVSVDGEPAASFPVNPNGSGLDGMLLHAEIHRAVAAIPGGRARNVPNNQLEVSKLRVSSRAGAAIRAFIDEEVRGLTLTIPRFRRETPPTHVLLARNGDLLRGRLVGANRSEVTFESRMEQFRLSRDRIAAILWLGSIRDPENETAAGPSASAGAANSGSSGSLAGTTPGADVAAQIPDQLAKNRELQLVLDGGFRITMTPARAVNGNLSGRSDHLGRCAVSVSAISELSVGQPGSRDHPAPNARWEPRLAREPDWDKSEPDSDVASPLPGTVVGDFELPLLDGGIFRLSDHADKVVLLDFWATWCGPCVIALPEYIDATAAFDHSKVILVTVNLSEESSRVRDFLAKQALSPVVALDRESLVAKQFGVSGIPHTVVLGPGSVLEHMHVGYRRGSGRDLQKVIRQILDGEWERPQPTR